MIAAGWISKREAVALVIAAQSDDAMGSRTSARRTLSEWRNRGIVRTKSGDRPTWAKYPRTLYRHVDIERKIAERRPWKPLEDALLGTNYDRVIARKIGRSYSSVCERRLKLRVPPFGPSSARRGDHPWR